MKKIIIAGCVLALASPVAAKDPEFVKTYVIKSKPAVTLDKAQAYILVRADQSIPLLLMKEPSAEDQALYDQLRAEAFADARKKYERALRLYKKEVNAGQPQVDKPVEPTEANFEFTPFGLMSSVSIGPMNRFAKDDDGGSTYLQAVTPGTYRLYGSILSNGNGMAGSCFCMGSVRFEAKPGEIVDMGTVLTKERAMAASFRLQPADGNLVIDPRLQSFTVSPAAYRPAGKLPNYFGLAIDRLAAIPGVMRYERDRIVDLTGK